MGCLSVRRSPSARPLHPPTLRRAGCVCGRAAADGSLNVFFGGLEGIVGSPSPNVRAMMAEEHTERDDSLIEFTTPNYHLRTTSAQEWAFVAAPDAPPPNGWPVEVQNHYFNV